MLDSIFNVLVPILDVVPNELYAKAFAYIGAGIAVLTGLGTGIGQGIAAAKQLRRLVVNLKHLVKF